MTIRKLYCYKCHELKDHIDVEAVSWIDDRHVCEGFKGICVKCQKTNYYCEKYRKELDVPGVTPSWVYRNNKRENEPCDIDERQS